MLALARSILSSQPPRGGWFLLPLLLTVMAPAVRAALPTDFEDQSVVEGLNQPVAFAFLPDGRMLIVEQVTHLVRLAVQGTPTTVLNVPEVNTSGGERGLLGIAVDPAWPTRPYIYLMHTRTPGNVSYIVRYKAAGDLTSTTSTNLALGRRLVLLADIPDNAGNHNGGSLCFAPDGMLYASLGEDADPCGAQDLTQLKGCILRLKVNALSDTFGITVAKSAITPADNPWVGMANANAKLQYAKGLRNPFSFSVNPADGRLYVADVGQSTYEEVNECAAGYHFGWPQYEGPATYGGYPGTCPATAPRGPLAWINRSGLTNASIVGAPIYHRAPGGSYNFPIEYEGDCFFGDYYNGGLRRLHRDANQVWQPAPAVPGQPDPTNWGIDVYNITHFQVGPDGAIYYCMQFGPASIRRIVYTGGAATVDEAGPGGPDPELRAAPNPLPRGAGIVNLEFHMDDAGPATVQLFSVAGRLVRTLSPGVLEPGWARIPWDARDDGGHAVPAGVYLARLTAGGRHATARIVITGR